MPDFAEPIPEVFIKTHGLADAKMDSKKYMQLVSQVSYTTVVPKLNVTLAKVTLSNHSVCRNLTERVIGTTQSFLMLCVQ